jgi:uncharacterized membrane protein YjjP (DUF1212 family)
MFIIRAHHVEPMAVNLLAVLLVLFAAYIGWWAVSFSAPLWWLASGVAFVAAMGLLRRKRLAQFAWHVIAFIVSIAWVVSVVRVALAGWPHSKIWSSIISLVPGMLLLLVCGCGSYVVAQKYQRAKNGL